MRGSIDGTFLADRPGNGGTAVRPFQIGTKPDHLEIPGF